MEQLIPLSIRNLSIGIGKRQVLSDVNLELHAGEFVSLMGENGVGKTLLLETILGYRKPLKGEIHLWGQPLASSDPTWLHARTAFVSASPEIYPAGAKVGDLLDSLSMSQPAWNRELAQSLLDGFRLNASQPLNGMSLGEGAKVRLLKALAIEPELLLLDELTANLSSEAKNTAVSVLIDIFSRKPMAVLYICHSQDEAFNLSDRVLTLEATGIFERDYSNVV